MNFMLFVYLVTSVIYIYIGAFSYTNDSKNRLNRIFFIVCLDFALWSLMLTLMSAAPDAVTATAFRRIASLFWSMTYCLLLHFMLVLVNRGEQLKKPWCLFLFYIPAYISIYLYFFYHPVTPENIVKIPLGWAYTNQLGYGFFWDNYLTFYYVSYVLACIFLVGVWGKQSPLKREKKQAKIIAGTIIAVLVLGSLTDIVLPALKIPFVPPLTVSFIIIPVYGIWYSIKRYRLMNLSPQNVVLEVMKTMQEGMIITNRKEEIQEMNAGASNMLGYSVDELRGKPIQVIFHDQLQLDPINTGNSNEAVLCRKNDEKLPVFYSTSTLLDEWGEPYGSVVTFQDLTETKKIQKELQQSHNELEMKVLQRTEELNAINQELKNEIHSRIEMQNEITKLAYFDPLTGLFNKKSFMDYVNKKIQENIRNELSLAVMYLDLDSFKMVNDTMGHVLGEELLKQVADRLKASLRISDTIARVAGDEFLILIQNNPDVKTIEIIASKLNDAFRKQFDLDGNEVHITASIGIALFPVDGEDADTLIKNADIAMYKAKEKGKNKFEICNTTMKTNLVEVMRLTNQLYRAVGKKEFELEYQPQVNISNGQIVGFEALIRWNQPTYGMIPPGKFIPIAEKTGLIIPIGEWVLETACRQMKKWQDQWLVAVPVAVNLSARQFMDYDMVALVSRVLKETGLNPDSLELEITESVLIEDSEYIREALRSLNQMGVRISIDDFGTEYSSLNYLKQLPINRVKIDMTFVQGISVNRKDEAIIQAIISLSRNLGIDILAEGVETFSQMEFLKKENCHVIQGFYLYRPMTPSHVEELFGSYV